MLQDLNTQSSLHPIEDTTPTHIPIPKKLSTPTQLFWVIFTSLSIIFFILGVPDRLTDLLEVPPDVLLALEQAGVSNLNWAIGMLLPEIVLMLVYTIIGISLFLQKFRDFTILLISTLLITWGTSIMNVVEALAVDHPNLEFWIVVSRAVSWSLVMTILLIFPNGRLYPKWSKWLLLVWWLLIWSWVFFPSLPHNIAFHGGLADPGRFVVYFSLLSIGVGAQVYRYFKIASSTERQQAKWAFLGISLMFLITFLEEAPSALDPSLISQTTPESIRYTLVSTGIFVLGSLAFPLGIAASIQQKRLWHIDFVINRSLVYTLITGFLALSFFVLYQVLQSLLFSLSNHQQPVIITIASAIIAVSLFKPARSTLQKFIDKRLFNIHIDYRHKPRSRPSINFKLLEDNQRIGDYEIVEMIARGGMSEIYKGIHIASGQEAAIKILSSPLSQRDDFRKRLTHEARIISQMDHPNIVKLYDYGETGEMYFIIMEFISYHSLAEKIKTDAPLSLEFTRHIIRQSAAALDYAHQRGIIHRDVKPSNLLLREADSSSEYPQPVLTDFGIAKTPQAYKPGRRRLHGFVGSFDYIAPEQIQASEAVDRRADIYSLGVITFQMLTGRLPFQTQTNAATLIAHLQHPPPNILAYNPQLPDQVAFAILKAMAKKPDERFNQASQFSQALQA